MSKNAARFEYICAWSGIATMVPYAICWGLIGHGAPAVGANLGAADVATHFAQYHTGILFGMTFAAVFGGLWMVWSAQVSVMMNRMAGVSPVLSLIQLGGGILTAWIIVSIPIFWVTAAFRPDLSPETVRLLDDLGFLMFNLTYIPTLLQAAATGIAGLCEESATPVFSPAVCWTVILCGLANVSVSLVAFFTTGPLAWNGWFNFYIPGAAFYIWGFTLSIPMIKNAARRLNADAPVSISADE